MNILLAGGAGYIGSHTAVSLLDAGHDVIIADNFMNSSPVAVDRIREVSGKPVTCYRADVCDTAAMERIFSENAVDCVIHFAGLKGVGESGTVPLKYYRNNIDTTLTLLECMAKFGVHNVVFSSSATVYGDENPIPYVETMRRGSSSHPYGWTKIFMEQIFEDAAKADPDLSVVLLRYFNPIGAHPSGRMGEDPRGVPNNLMPYISQVAVGRREQLTVFGDDYPTPDGTCRRDYLHVMDLAEGHLEAVEYAAGHRHTIQRAGDRSRIRGGYRCGDSVYHRTPPGRRPAGILGGRGQGGAGAPLDSQAGPDGNVPGYLELAEAESQGL